MERLHSKVTSSMCHVRERLSSYFVYTLLERRQFHSLMQIYKILHRVPPPYLFNLFRYARDVTDHQGRNPHRLYVPRVRTNYGKSSLYFRGTFLWNSLHPSLYTLQSVALFKRTFHNLNFN